MPLALHLPHAVTHSELERISRANPGLRFERSARGELLVSPPVGTLGSFGEGELYSQVAAWAQKNGQGAVTAPDAGFTLPDGSVFAPDTAWISHERWHALPPKARKGYARTAPEVAFELLSPNDKLADARTKASAYIRNGTCLVVLLHPRSHLVELHRPNVPVASYPRASKVPCDPELPGFMLDATKIFARLKSP